MIWFLLPLLGCTGAPASEEGHDEHAGEEHGGEAHAGEAGEVTLSAEALTAAALTLGPAKTGPLPATLGTTARIELDARREARVGARAAGQVERIHVSPGDRVAEGQTLATVLSPDLGEGIATFHGARAMSDAAKARLERLRALEKDEVASRGQVLEAEAELAVQSGALEAAEERLRLLGVDPGKAELEHGEHFASTFPVRSPVAGEVLAAEASVGRSVEPGDLLFHVGDLDEVWLVMDIYERDLSRVAAGQEVRFTVEAWPGESFVGSIDRVGSWVEPEARTVEVRVLVSNADHRLKPNMFAQADVALGGMDSGPQTGIVVPREALGRVDGKAVVFVQEDEHTFAAREVVVAEERGGWARLASGVEPGEVIVLAGTFALVSELEKSELGEGHAH